MDLISRFVVWLFTAFITNVLWAGIFTLLWVIVLFVFGGTTDWAETFRTTFWVFMVFDTLKALYKLGAE